MDVCLFAETGLNNMKEVKIGKSKLESENWKVKMKMKMSIFFSLFLLRQVRMYLEVGMINTVLNSGTRKAVQVR